jgi:hypothetical protein
MDGPIAAGTPPIEIERLAKDGTFTVRNMKGIPQKVKHADKLLYDNVMYKLKYKESLGERGLRMGFVARGVNEKLTYVVVYIQEGVSETLHLYIGPPQSSESVVRSVEPKKNPIPGVRQILLTSEDMILLGSKTTILGTFKKSAVKTA